MTDSPECYNKRILILVALLLAIAGGLYVAFRIYVVVDLEIAISKYSSSRKVAKDVDLALARSDLRFIRGGKRCLGVPKAIFNKYSVSVRDLGKDHWFRVYNKIEDRHRLSYAKIAYGKAYNTLLLQKMKEKGLLILKAGSKPVMPKNPSDQKVKEALEKIETIPAPNNKPQDE